MAKKIEKFTGEYKFLSNFYPCGILYEEIKYPSVEHAFQALKTFDIEKRRKIASLKKPGLAKKMGHRVKLRPDWEEIKINLMEELIRIKFKNHDNLKELLLKTGNSELIEGNYWGDRYWGVFEGKGKNILGKILMKIRDEMRNNNF